MSTHWVPFVLIGHAQRWSTARLGAIVACAAAGHALVTGAVGVIVAIAGREIRGILEIERLGGAILVAFGALYIVLDLRHVGHRHVHHVHDGVVHDSAHKAASLSDRAAMASLVVLLSLSPCVALTPVFFGAGQAGGLRAALVIGAVNALVTVPVMTAMVVLAALGLSRLPLERLERKERALVGLLLVVIGLVVLASHPEHHAHG